MSVPIFRRDRPTDTSREPASQAPEPADLATLLLEGEDMLGRLAEAHRTHWGLGTADSWALDPAAGTLTWTFPDRTATAPAQLLGVHTLSTGVWLWGWAHPGVPPGMRRDADMLRDWAETHEHQAFTTSEIEVQDAALASLIAIAVRVTRATGFYRGSGAVSPVLTFGPVTLRPHDGPATTYQIGVAGADEV